jgi:hypothetical protein
MHAHLLRPAGGLPFPPAALERLDEFLLLGIHADHRVAGVHVGAGMVVDAAELGVPVRVACPLDLLSVALQAEVLVLQQRGHGGRGHLVPGRGQLGRQMAGRLAARATTLIPPWPSTLASAPITSRRCRASRCGNNAPNFAASSSSACIRKAMIWRLLWHLEALAACRAEGRLWVITGAGDRPAGFLITGMVDGCLHIERVSVDPGSAQRGLGGHCSITRRPRAFRRSR